MIVSEFEAKQNSALKSDALNHTYTFAIPILHKMGYNLFPDEP